MLLHKKQKYLKKIMLGAIVFFAVFAVTTVIKAGVGDNTSGWLWGGGVEPDGAAPYDGTNTNVGWISTNSTFCDPDGDGKSNGSLNCPKVGAPVGQYGLNIPANGPISGYAWSEHTGWISFNKDDVASCPSSPCLARSNGVGYLTGWARILSIKDASALGNSGGWQGYIKLSGTAQNGSTYGVTKNAGGKLSGSAWSDELGWIDFSRATTGALPAPPSPLLPSFSPPPSPSSNGSSSIGRWREVAP